MAFQSVDNILSNIPDPAVVAARAAYAAGQYADAWRILAQAGDRYADNAAGVVGGGDPADKFFQTLVKNHWDATAGAGVYEQKFNTVAGQHLDNYLSVLEDHKNQRGRVRIIFSNSVDAGRSAGLN